MRLRSFFVVSIAAAVVPLTGTTAAQASALPDLQQQIDVVLEQAPGGQQISENQVAWQDETVILTIPRVAGQAAHGADEPVTTLGTPNCPYTWTCLYEHANYNGRRLQFSACGYIQDLGAYGFRDKATSWHNNQTRGTRSWVYNWTGSWTLLWTEGGAPSMSPNVGPGNNDKADGIKAC